MKIYDRYSNERDWMWLVANYGPLVIHPADAGPGWRIVEIREDADLDKLAGRTLEEIKRTSPQAAPTIIVKVLDAVGRPVDLARVAWYWPDCREDPNAAPTNGLPAGVKQNRAEDGYTNLNGDTGFGMGRGAYYYPPAIGPHAVWIYGQNSDVILGLGMIGETNHNHVNVTYRQTVEEPPTPPIDPPDDDDDGLFYTGPDGNPIKREDVVAMFGEPELGVVSQENYPLFEVGGLRWKNGTGLYPRVFDEYGEPIAGVEVFLKNNRSNRVMRALTGDSGECYFDLSGDEHGYNVPAEKGPNACGLIGMPCQMYDTAGRVKDKNLGPRTLSPDFFYTTKPFEPEPEPPADLDDVVDKLEHALAMIENIQQLVAVVDDSAAKAREEIAAALALLLEA